MSTIHVHGYNEAGELVSEFIDIPEDGTPVATEFSYVKFPMPAGDGERYANTLVDRIGELKREVDALKDKHERLKNLYNEASAGWGRAIDALPNPAELDDMALTLVAANLLDGKAHIRVAADISAMAADLRRIAGEGEE